MEELFKDVANYEGIYQVSNFGNVKTLQRNIYNKLGKLHYIQPEKLLKPSVFKNGYKYISMHKNKKIKVKTIHSLVAEAFIENTYNKRTVNHIDGNKLNNHFTNLEWATDKENLEHNFVIGISKRYSLIAYNNNTYLEFSKVSDACKLGFSQKSISNSVIKNKKYKGFYWKYKGESSHSAQKQTQIDKFLK